MEKHKLEDVLEEIETQELQNQLFIDLSDSVYEADNLNLTDSDIVRIEENVPFHWSGVTGCNNHDSCLLYTSPSPRDS